MRAIIRRLLFGLIISTAPAFAADEESSKINAYPVLNAGTDSAMSASKADTYPVLNAGTASAMSVSKMNTYIVIYGIHQHTTPLFHSFPP